MKLPFVDQWNKILMFAQPVRILFIHCLNLHADDTHAYIFYFFLLESPSVWFCIFCPLCISDRSLSFLFPLTEVGFLPFRFLSVSFPLNLTFSAILISFLSIVFFKDLLLANEEQSDTCLATSSSGETIEVNSQSNVADIVVDCRLARRSRAQAALRRLEAKSNMSSGRLSPGLSEGETIPSTLASPRSDGDTACDVLEETVRPLVTLAINCPISVQCYPPPQVCVSIPVTVASVQSVVVENSSSLHLVPDPVISDVQSFSSEETLSNKEYLLSLDELDVELLSDVFGDIPVSRTENHSVSFSATHLTETEDDEPDVPLIRVDDDNHASTSLSLRIGSLSSSSDALFKLPSRSVEFGR